MTVHRIGDPSERLLVCSICGAAIAQGCAELHERWHTGEPPPPPPPPAPPIRVRRAQPLLGLPWWGWAIILVGAVPSWYAWGWFIRLHCQ